MVACIVLSASRRHSTATCSRRLTPSEALAQGSVHGHAEVQVAGGAWTLFIVFVEDNDCEGLGVRWGSACDRLQRCLPETVSFCSRSCVHGSVVDLATTVDESNSLHRGLDAACAVCPPPPSSLCHAALLQPRATCTSKPDPVPVRIRIRTVGMAAASPRTAVSIPAEAPAA